MEIIPIVLAIIVLLLLLFAGIPVAISLASSGTIGLLVLSGPDLVSSVIADTSYSAVGKSNLVVVPMFVLMGMLTLHSGIAERLFAFAARGLRTW
jgi:TRAP-type mannitol/chloroaromatic compound transport system permease large subunit